MKLRNEQDNNQFQPTVFKRVSMEKKEEIGIFSQNILELSSLLVVATKKNVSVGFKDDSTSGEFIK